VIYEINPKMTCEYPSCRYCTLPNVICGYCQGDKDNLPCNCGLADDACFCSYLDRTCFVCKGTGKIRPFGIEWIPFINDFMDVTPRDRVKGVILAYNSYSEIEIKTLLDKIESRIQTLNKVENKNERFKIYGNLIDLILEIQMQDNEYIIPCYWKRFIDNCI
jgi:hypothetical protein